MEKDNNVTPSFDEIFKNIEANMAKKDRECFSELNNLMSNIDPLYSAATFCGLASIGVLQSNHIRITNLIHASIKFGMGKEKIKWNQIYQFFNILSGSSADRHEDPAEDVFIARACSKRGSFKIFEGNWEGSTFFLERFLDIVDSMPDKVFFKDIKKSVYALVYLSDIIASKSEVEVNVVSGPEPLSKIPNNIRTSPGSLLKRIMFTEDDLKVYGFYIKDLLPFIFNISEGKDLPFPCHQSLTELDKHPILDIGDGKYCLFPQGIIVCTI